MACPVLFDDLSSSLSKDDYVSKFSYSCSYDPIWSKMFNSDNLLNSI